MERIGASDDPSADGLEGADGEPAGLEFAEPEAWPEDADDYLQLSRHLRCLAVTLVSDEASADDVVQEAWLAALDGPHERVRNLNAWLSQVVRNLARRRLGRAARRREVETLWAPVEGEDEVEPESDGIERESGYQLLREAANELEEPFRAIVHERFFEERSLAEIARRTGRPLNTIKSQVHRGVAKLREILDRRAHGDRAAWSLALLSGLVERDGAALSQAEPTAAGGSSGASGGTLAAARVPAWAFVPVLLLVPAALIFGWRVLRIDDGMGTMWGNGAPVSELAGASMAPAARSVASPQRRPVEMPAGTRPGEARDPDESPPPVVASVATRRVVLTLNDAATGEPVAGAHAHVWGRLGEFLGAHPSDARGRVVLELSPSDLDETARFPTDPGVSITARRAGAAWSFYYHLPVPEDGAQLALDLPSEGQDVTGLVHGPDGEPVEGASVSVRGSARYGDITSEGVPFGERILKAQTDEDGRFVIEGLPVRAHEVFAQAPGWLPGRVALEEAGERLEVEVALERGASLRGTLVLEDGSPAAGARVFDGRFGFRGEVGSPPETLTDEDGRFRLDGFMLGEQRVFATLDDGRGGSAATIVDFDTVRGDSAEPRTWNATLRVEPTLKVRVLDADGTPHEGAKVVVAQATGPAWAVRGRVDAEGLCEFRALPAGDLAVMVHRDIRDRTPAALRRDVRPGPEEIVLRLPAVEPRAGRLTGSLKGPDGSPLRSAVLLGCGTAGSFRVDVEPDGSFACRTLAPGEYEAWGIAEGIGTIELGTFVILEDELLELGRVAPTTEPGRLRIRVLEQGPSEDAPYVVSAHPRCGAEEGFVVAVVRDRDAELQLMPGRYSVRPADRAAEGVVVTLEAGRESAIDIER